MMPNSYRVHFGKGTVYEARGEYEARCDRSRNVSTLTKTQSQCDDCCCAEVLTDLHHDDAAWRLISWFAD
ncbi:MAG: hypothetical protein J2P54_19880 [Bradyrhizobiaceae bacterium]|nr:hypothetical protein [Bradyrhizobiaceae bacterium]